jgi:alpha-L-rhamnosidase
MRVIGLTTEYAVNPLGLDAARPRLGWRLEASARGARQTAYQLRAAPSAEWLRAGHADLWDSGRVDGAQSQHVEYAGPALASGQRVWWQVRAWDGYGQVTEWSAPAWWEMGLLDPADWRVRWISAGPPADPEAAQPVPLLRGTFDVDGAVASARLYVTSQGVYALELNGQPVSDWLFTPGWTSYHKRLQYQSHDVTRLLRPGRNALGAMLGEGWYRGRIARWPGNFLYGPQMALLAQVVITLADGRVVVWGTDGSWRTAAGPILASDIYIGEDCDARLERPGWSAPDHDDADWRPITLLPDLRRNLVAQVGPPVRRMHTLRPISVFVTPAGETVLDFGQNLVGWVRMRVTGVAGTTVTLRHAETLDPRGNFYTANLRAALQVDRYTLKGGAEEVYEPRFTFHGFRYAAVEGYPGTVTPAAFEAVVVYSDLPAAGEFECSHEKLNQLQRNILWSQRGNFLDVPTDCPQRDERLGWTGDAQVFARTAAFNLNVAAFLTKWLRDVAADQYPDGAVPFVVPDTGRGAGATGWGDAAVIVPWTLYQCYGDARVLREQFDSMAAWVGYMRAQAGASLIWDGGFHFGDWQAVEAPDPQYPNPVTDFPLICTAYFAYSAGLLAQAAQVLGREAEAAEYKALAKRVRAAFNHEFVAPSGRIGPNTQTAYALALAFDLLPERLRPEAARRLAADVRRRGNHLSTGFLGAPHLCPALSGHGYLDVAYALVEQETYPSWLYPLSKGATTIWERWDAYDRQGELWDPNANSFNHYAYGAIGDWLYRVVAGLDLDPAAPGYRRIIIRPRPGGSLTHARARHVSLYGEIECGWKLEAGGLRLDVTIPPNTTAVVHLPAANVNAVTEGGQPLGEAAGVVAVRPGEGEVVVEVGAGKYVFAVRSAT